jgi:hypothetical protein
MNDFGFSFQQGAGAPPVFILIVIILGVLIGLAVTALTVFSFCRIFSKAGYSWAFGLLLLIPVANIVVPLVLALSDWPIEKQLRQARHQQPNT